MRNTCVTLSLAVGLILGSSGLATAEVFNPEKGAPSPDSEHNPAFILLPDDAYDGTIGSMACLTVPGVPGAVTDIDVDINIDHTWIGDLVFKVVAPDMTTVTLQSRAGFAEPADDGTGCCGDSSDLQSTDTLAYADGNPTSAEDMGSTILGGDFACGTDGLCDYFPFPDAGPGAALADFIGVEGGGDWMVCAGDSAAGDTGDLVSANINMVTAGADPIIEVPTVGAIGLAALLALLALGGVATMRRRANAQ